MRCCKLPWSTLKERFVHAVLISKDRHVLSFWPIMVTVELLVLIFAVLLLLFELVLQLSVYSLTLCIPVHDFSFVGTALLMCLAFFDWLENVFVVVCTETHRGFTVTSWVFLFVCCCLTSVWFYLTKCSSLTRLLVNVKLPLIDEDMIDVELAMPNSLASLILAPSYVELKLAKVVHLVVAVVRATKYFVQFWICCFCHFNVCVLLCRV